MEKRIMDSNEDQRVLQYYVAKQNCNLNRMSGQCDMNLGTLRLGMLVKSLEDLKDEAVKISVTDTSGSKLWCNTEWRCHKSNLILVSPEVWQFLLAVPVPQDRVRLANNKLLCDELKNIRINDKVWYQFDSTDQKTLAIVKYIGPVSQLGQGLYFGLDLLENKEPSKTALLCEEYFEAIYLNGILANFSNIFPYKTENSTVLGNLEKCNLSDKSEDQKEREISSNLTVGSNVKVCFDSDIQSGIIRWIGIPHGITSGKVMAAVELDDGHPLGTDGTYNQVRYFHCRPCRAIFIDIDQCSRYDPIMQTEADEQFVCTNTNNFGSMESSVIEGIVKPICVEGNLESICGKYRGIQGHHNSCYLDATLFSMFAFTSVFDNLLFRPPNEKDCSQYEEVQRVLREEIVNPLRKNMFVRADRVMKLRTLLEKLSSVSGLTSEEKDPEEFLTSLVAQILNAEPFLKLSSGQDAYHYQLFVEKDDHLNLPTVQQLLEQSFLTSNIRLKEVPSCLIIQMPRFGKSFKMYQKIQPTLLLDITDIIEDSPRQCTICGQLAEFECKECYGERDVGLESITFCLKCLEILHRHEHRANHKPKKLTVPMEFTILQEHCPVPRLYLELSAVVCIETSHYVSFVKCGSGSEAPWCFFDSMADRKGEQNGYNIPEMVPCPSFPYWLSEAGGNYLTKLTDDRHLPEHAKRLLCDAYMCMYQSLDVMMYK